MPPALTVTSTVWPAVPGGAVTVMVLPFEATETTVAGVPPKDTAVAPVNPAPWMVTVVPPDVACRRR